MFFPKKAQMVCCLPDCWLLGEHPKVAEKVSAVVFVLVNFQFRFGWITSSSAKVYTEHYCADG